MYHTWRHGGNLRDGIISIIIISVDFKATESTRAAFWMVDVILDDFIPSTY